MARQRYNQSLVFFDQHDLTVTPGANRGFGTEVLNLHGQIEGMDTGDGYVLRVSKMRFTIRTRCVDTHAVYFAFVQCSVNGVTQANQSDRNVHVVLDAVYGDEFGFVPIEEHSRLARRIGINQGHAAPTDLEGINITFEAPPRILAILNKETQSERLQDLHLAVVGYGVSSSIIYFKVNTEVRYTKTIKPVVLR